MAETQVVERTAEATVVRIGGNGQQVTIPATIPVLPIRNVVVFPGTVMPLNVGRPKSKNLLDEVMPGEKIIGVVTQKNAESEDPKYPDLNTVGVASMILKLFKLLSAVLWTVRFHAQIRLYSKSPSKRALVP